MEFCLLAGGKLVRLGVSALTLSWTHSVEKTRWEEDLHLRAAGLIVVEARVAASGAGMEPAPDARLEGGVWRWRPSVAPMQRIVLRRSGATEDWTICTAGHCRLVGEIATADPVVLTACP